MQSNNNVSSSSQGYGKTLSTLWGPVMICQQQESDGLECSVHTLPKPLMREFRHVFDESSLPVQPSASQESSEAPQLLAIPTNQRALHDLVAVGDDIEKEKDRLLNVFMAFSQGLCQKIRDAGYWADFIDPCSGLPMIGRENGNKVYSEVDGMQVLLNYSCYNAGFCKILTHPVWGSSIYPATIFACAPRQVVIDLLGKLSNNKRIT